MITSQNDTAPKRGQQRATFTIRLITSQNDTAPKQRTRKANIELGRKFVEDYHDFSEKEWYVISCTYWEEHYKSLGVPFYDTDTTEAEKILKEVQHKWLMENAQRYGYNYYIK